MSNEKTVTKAQVRKDLRNLGYSKVSIRTRRSPFGGETFAKIFVYGPDGECLVGDFNVYFPPKLEKARAALDYISQLPKRFDTGEIIH